ALEGDELIVTAALGEGDEAALGTRSRSTGWRAGDVLQSRGPLAYEDTAADEGLAEWDSVLAAGHRAYLGVPVAARDGRLHGVPAAEAIGRTTAQVLQRELESEAGGSSRTIAIPRAGGGVWLSLSEAVMRDPSGATAGRIFAFRDISTEHLGEQMKSDFVSTV